MTEIVGKHLSNRVLAPPAAPVKLTEIVGQWAAKRALEVALVGDHSVLLLGNEYGQAEELAEWGRQHGLHAQAVYPCPCSFRHAGPRECTCSPLQIVRWREERVPKNFDIYIAVVPPDTFQVSDWLAGRRGEPDAVVLERVTLAKEVPIPRELDDIARALFESALKRGVLSASRLPVTQRLAASVARLAGHAEITSQDVAEAMQYVVLR